jgi:hydrogenase expression/formation protein HypE|tara:strand:- start:7920 stop:8975 length:1056 start_codon:yes stop_codon:yes gene_type:complete
MKMKKKHIRFPKRLNFNNGKVEMSHGSGGRAMSQLIEELFQDAFTNSYLRKNNDQAVLPVDKGKIAFTTDSFVINPLFFPGGNIGSLAVHGTINDLSMSGAEPLYLSAGFILEEGFPFSDLKKIIDSMAKTAENAGVKIVTGDTKVVHRGQADGLYINTTGIGVIPNNINISAERALPGDAILISGPIGDHGIAVMAEREGLSYSTSLVSDAASLNGLVKSMVEAVEDIHVMRDLTRGGLAAAMNEISTTAGVGMLIEESAIPVRPEVLAACEIFGYDPLNVANEGKLMAICPSETSEILLEAMTNHPLGVQSSIIGKVIEDEHSFVEMKTQLGGRRLVDWISGVQLPRIC